MSRARRNALIVGLVLAAQAAAVVLYQYVDAQRRAPRFGAFQFENITWVEPLAALPALPLERADGSALAVDSLQGRPVLLHFWATWCPPCRDELPGLLELAAREPKLTVLAISLDDDWAAVQRFFSGPVPAAVVRDPGRSLQRQFAVGELPDTYLLSGDTRPGLRFAGARDWRSEAARAALRPFLR